MLQYRSRSMAVAILALVVLFPGVAAAQSGPVAAYGFEEGTGPTVADSSGNNNAGTIGGATWTSAGKFGNALSFNGSTNWVTVAHSASLNLTTGMTLEAWVKPAALGSWRSVIL